jgi:hypothetical protein
LSELVFLLEEPSMRDMLAVFLPKVVPAGLPFHLVTHEGKADLQRSIPRKLRAWQTPGARFIVLHDKDSADCRRLKTKLRMICSEAGPDVLIRIVCHELEAWFLGDFAAIEAAFQVGNLVGLESRARYRDPDRLANASQELKRLIPSYQKLRGARSVGQYLDPERNRSRSFQVFVQGLTQMIAALRPPAPELP